MAIFSRFLFGFFSSSNSRIQPLGPEHMTNRRNPSKTQLPVLPTAEKTPLESYLYANRRLRRELVINSRGVPSDLISFSLENLDDDDDDDDDLFVWRGIIYGAINTPFEGGIFHLSLKIPHSYPFTPPTVKFKTKVYHPYIDENGVIDVDILGTEWTPSLSVEKLMVSICSFLLNPDPVEEDENEIAALYRRDRRMYDEIAREWTLKYAMST